MNQGQIKEFIALCVAQKEAVIQDALGGALVNMVKVRSLATMAMQKDGSEIFIYKGKPILKFFPVEFEQVTGSGAMVIRATQNYERLHETESVA